MLECLYLTIVSVFESDSLGTFPYLLFLLVLFPSLHPSLFGIGCGSGIGFHVVQTGYTPFMILLPPPSEYRDSRHSQHIRLLVTCLNSRVPKDQPRKKATEEPAQIEASGASLPGKPLWPQMPRGNLVPRQPGSSSVLRGWASHLVLQRALAFRATQL